MTSIAKVKKPTRWVALKLRPEILAILEEDIGVRNEKFAAMFPGNSIGQPGFGRHQIRSPKPHRARVAPIRLRISNCTHDRSQRPKSDSSDSPFNTWCASFEEMKAEYQKIKEERDKLARLNSDLSKSSQDLGNSHKANREIIEYLTSCLTQKNDQIERLELENASLKKKLRTYKAIEAMVARNMVKKE